MTWDYAELSRAAKQAGGPEKLLAMVEENAKNLGRIEGASSMVPWVGAAAVAASAITGGVFTLINYLKSKKAISQAAMDEAKAELIQGIKEYDASHPKKEDDAASEENNEI